MKNILLSWSAKTLGAILLALGLLWILQGTQIVKIEPILCFAKCEPLDEFSWPWIIQGILSSVAGGALVFLTQKSLMKSKEKSDEK